MKMVTVCLLIVVLVSCSVTPASADLGLTLTNIKNVLFPDVKIKAGSELSTNQQAALKSAPVDKFKALDQRVTDETTDDNLQKLYAVMRRYGYTAVRVDVVDEKGTCQRSYYLVRDGGIVTSHSGSLDAAYQITYDEALNILDMVQDGSISFNEKVEIAQILSGKPWIYEYLKLTMAG